MELFNKSCVSLAVLAFVQSCACAATYDTIHKVTAGSTITDDIVVNVANGVFTPGRDQNQVAGLYIEHTDPFSSIPDTNINGQLDITLNGRYSGNNSNWDKNFAGIATKNYQQAHASNVIFDKQISIKLGIDVTSDAESRLIGIYSADDNFTFNDAVDITFTAATQVSGTNEIAGVFTTRSKLTFNNGLSVNSNLNDNKGDAQISGLMVNEDGEINVNGLTKISGKFYGDYGQEFPGAAVVIKTTDSGLANFESLQYIRDDGDLKSYAIGLLGSGSHLVLRDETKDIASQIKGKTYIDGSTADLHFKKSDSFFESNIERKFYKKEALNLYFSNGATWFVIDEKDVVDKLDLTDGGILDFKGVFTEKTNDADAFQIVQAKDFKSSNKDNRGIVNFKVDVAANKSDKLVIQSAEKAENYLTAAINWKGADSDALYLNNALIEQNGGTLTVVNKDGNNQHYRAGGVSSWHVTFVEDGQNVDFDDADFRGDTTLNTGSGKGKWYLMKDEEKGSDLLPEVADNLVLGTSAAQAMSFAHDNKTLRHRIGEVRYGTQDGSWVRVDAHKDSFKTGFKQKTYGIMVGYDSLTARQNDSVWLLGGAFRYADSDQEALGLRQVDGKLQQYSAKLYGTWIHDQGSYADIVLQAGRFEQEMNGLDNLGTGSAKADYTTYGFGASVEVGHNFKFNQNAQTNGHWFVEPQFQLSYFRANGKDYTTSTGMAVSQGDADFLTGRAGAVIGKKFNLGTLDDPRYFQIALTGGLNHEFLGDQNIRYVGTDKAVKSVKAKGIDGTRVYYGLTADWQCTDNLRAYAYVEREDGDGYTQEYDFNVGLKYMF